MKMFKFALREKYLVYINLKQREYILKSNLSCVEDLLFYIQPLTNLKKMDLSGL